MKFRYLLTVVFLLLAGTANAQTNCMNLTVAGPQIMRTNGVGFTASETQTWNASCNNTSTKKVTSTFNLPITALGDGGTRSDKTFIDCEPAFSAPNVTNPTSVVNSTLHLFAVDNVFNKTTGACQAGPTHTSDGFCVAVACPVSAPPPDPPPSCPACNPPPGQPPGFGTLTCCSPIIISTADKGFRLTDAQHGVKFDISGTGNPIDMAWTAADSGDAFLALPEKDGLVHNGKDLFGSFTPQPKVDQPNGFNALAVYDKPEHGGNGDGVIDSSDAIFSSLRLWIDANHDGISQPEEVHTLASLGVHSISLKYELSTRVDRFGNVFRYKARINPDEPEDPNVGRVLYDVFFQTLDPVSKCAKPAMATGK